MKFSCGLTNAGRRNAAKQKAEELRKWRKKFLWFPTTTHREGEREMCEWLVRVEVCWPNAWLYGWDRVVKGDPRYREITK